MLKSFIGIDDIKECLKDITERLNKLDEKLTTQNTTIIQLQTKAEKNTQLISQLNTQSTQILDSLNQEVENIRNKLTKEVNCLINVKDTIKRKLLSDFKEDIKKEVNTLNTETINTFEIKRDIKETTQILNSIKAYAKRLELISNNLKSEDFKIKNFCEFIDKNTREKNSLENQIQKLKTIISKERRKRY